MTSGFDRGVGGRDGHKRRSMNERWNERINNTNTVFRVREKKTLNLKKYSYYSYLQKIIKKSKHKRIWNERWASYFFIR